MSLAISEMFLEEIPRAMVDQHDHPKMGIPLGIVTIRWDTMPEMAMAIAVNNKAGRKGAPIEESGSTVNISA